jgi:hypothetical protein
VILGTATTPGHNPGQNFIETPCPHVDSTPGIRPILDFKKSIAPLAISFQEMYLGASLRRAFGWSVECIIDSSIADPRGT